jgi:uncharacterized protein YndB with AHSA1/START domain
MPEGEGDIQMKHLTICGLILLCGMVLFGHGCEAAGTNPDTRHGKEAAMKEQNRLELTTPSEQELRMTRTFDAPRERVFEALTTPAQVRQWLLGPPGWTMTVCEIDLREGGAYRYEWRHDGDGITMGMGGVFREVSRPHRIVQTERFDEPWYPGEALVTGELQEQDGRTTLVSTVRYESQEARDMVLNSGMEHGVAASYDRLEALLNASPAKEPARR